MRGSLRTHGRITCAASLLALTAAAATDAADAPYTVAYVSFGPVNSAVFIADADGRHERLLVEGAKLDASPSFARDGRSVVFTSRRDGSADIYRVQTDGSHLERLTDDPAFDDQAVLSPDATQLAFVSSRSGQADVWVLELRTRRLRNLTSHPAGDYRPAWSPDGKWIAFTSDRDSEGKLANSFALAQSTELYLVRPDGSGLRRLTDGEPSVGGAAWSPDGAHIAFYEADPTAWQVMSRNFPGPPAASQIVSIDAATGTRAILTSGPGRKVTPKWLGPKGRIAYVRADTAEDPASERREPSYRAEGIAFVDGTTGPQGAFVGADWSADGKHMVFQRDLDGEWPPVTPAFSRDAGFRVVRAGVFPSYAPGGGRLASNSAVAANRHNSILLMKPDGTDRKVLFDDPRQNAVAPVWSPDGTQIAFGLGTFFPRPGALLPAQVAVMAADGTGLRTITPAGSANHGFPSWSPDGKRMVIRVAQEKTKGLAILDVGSGASTPLTAGAWNDNFPTWSPKGDLIVFASDREGDWELYSIRPDGTDVKRLTHTKDNDSHPSFSWDGEWIAFTSARGGFKAEMALGGGGQGSGDIFVMRPDGSDVRRLTDDAFEEGTPAFAPR